MFSRFVCKDFSCGGVSKAMPVMMAVSTYLIDFNVIFTRRNSIVNFPSASLKGCSLKLKDLESFLKVKYTNF